MAVILAGCGGDDAPTPPKVAITPVGTAQGAPDSMVVGATGGTFASSDGQLTITVPPGALAADTMLTIQPITNEAPGGAGAAYRLGPEGQTFAVPATLTFAFDATLIAGSQADALDVAFQDALGEWRTLKQITRTANSDTVTTLHFSDWSRVVGFSLKPASASVVPGNSLALAVQICASKEDGDELTFLKYECGTDAAAFLTEMTWKVNGGVGGAELGTITPNDNDSAVFHAPAVAPSQNPVAVSSEFHTSKGQVLLVANVFIGEAPLGGTITTTQIDGAGLTVETTATVRFDYNDTLMGYSSSSGTVMVTRDLAAQDGSGCTTHATGAAAINAMDGYIVITSGSYFFGGGTMVTVTGATTCPVGPPEPFTITEVYQWWPSIDGTYLVKPDGSLMESVMDAPFGINTVTMQWSIAPGAN